MITGKRTWSKQILRKKYFTGDKERCLEKPTKVQKGSPIFSLCKRALPHFTSKLTWIPGNGAKIQIWEDSILGEQPLNGVKELENIKAWLNANNCSTLWDISSWENDDKEAWASWNLGDYPDELKEEASNLLELLQGKSLVSARSKDKRGWGLGSGKYTAAAGYTTILETPWVSPNPALWKALYNFPSIPKVDIFIWTLIHNSILTDENLKRKG